ncbi:hypothetical protein M5K25_001820 [Dendrobium thyrsiflorum]|uniref:Uncharacterized protein n=1 Tax=Dendrobium thyrsiflorum TaxID=117978 RepID=A0ABD0VRH7_DENTH
MRRLSGRPEQASAGFGRSRYRPAAVRSAADLEAGVRPEARSAALPTEMASIGRLRHDGGLGDGRAARLMGSEMGSTVVRRQCRIPPANRSRRLVLALASVIADWRERTSERSRGKSQNSSSFLP